MKCNSDPEALMKLEGMERNLTCSKRIVAVSEEMQLIRQLAMSRTMKSVRLALLRESYVSWPNLNRAPGFSPEKPRTEMLNIFKDDFVAFTSESYPSHLKLVKLQS